MCTHAAASRKNQSTRAAKESAAAKRTWESPAFRDRAPPGRVLVWDVTSVEPLAEAAGAAGGARAWVAAGAIVVPPRGVVARGVGVLVMVVTGAVLLALVVVLGIVVVLLFVLVLTLELAITCVLLVTAGFDDTTTVEVFGGAEVLPPAVGNGKGTVGQ